MTHVGCAQFRYTWAERRLDGRGGGFGVVLRSADWPPGLLEDPRLRNLLTNIPGDVRQESPETADAVVTQLRVLDGSLLIATRPVGQDGAGRPGNYAVHALFDPTATLGSLDLEPLVNGGTFVLERDVDIEPRDDAPPITVWAAPHWRANGTRGRAANTRVEPQHGPYGDEPLTYEHAADLAAVLRGLCRRLPADLVNQLQVTRSERQSLTLDDPPRGEIDRLVEQFAEAVELGVVDQDLWWQRRSYGAESWLSEVHDFVLMNQPISRVPDELLWTRWDGATERGRSMVAKETLRRGSLTSDPVVVAEVERRPELLNEILEAGIKGRPGVRAVAAQWVAAAGDDAQVIDFAAELRFLGDSELPKPLLDRLQSQPPDALPALLASTVAEHLDGALPLDPVWRAHCLRLRLVGEPTCAHPDQLITSSSKPELVEATRVVLAEDTGDLDTCWGQLSPLAAVSRAEILLPVGARVADFLLRRDLEEPAQAPPPLISLWPSIGRQLGWAQWARALPIDLDRKYRQLRAQRLVLLIAVALLAITAVVLGIL